MTSCSFLTPCSNNCNLHKALQKYQIQHLRSMAFSKLGMMISQLSTATLIYQGTNLTSFWPSPKMPRSYINSTSKVQAPPTSFHRQLVVACPMNISIKQRCAKSGLRLGVSVLTSPSVDLLTGMMKCRRDSS